jgi:hypothetical protein
VEVEGSLASQRSQGRGRLTATRLVSYRQGTWSRRPERIPDPVEIRGADGSTDPVTRRRNMLRELVRELWMSKRHMPRSCLGLLTLVALLSTPACILRPGMNSDCTWPPEPVKALDLGSPSDHRHLIVDAELLEELVDRYRFRPPDEQRQCEQRLAAVVASLHSVDVSDVARAREDIRNGGSTCRRPFPLWLFSCGACCIFCEGSSAGSAKSHGRWPSASSSHLLRSPGFSFLPVNCGRRSFK